MKKLFLIGKGLNEEVNNSNELELSSTVQNNRSTLPPIYKAELFFYFIEIKKIKRYFNRVSF